MHQLTVQIQELLQDKVNTLNDAALGYPTFPLSLSVFRVLVGCVAAILACSLAHGTHVAHRETFLKNYLHRVKRQQLSWGNSRSLASAPCEPVSLNTGRLAARADEFIHRDLQGSFQLGILPLMRGGRSDVECERKNDHCKNETVLGRKFTA